MRLPSLLSRICDRGEALQRVRLDATVPDLASQCAAALLMLLSIGVAAERLIAFADLEGIESLPDDSLENLLRSSLETAIAAGELPENTTISAGMVGLVSIFYGVPLAMQYANPAAIGAMYRQQLELLWAGLREVVRK